VAILRAIAITAAICYLVLGNSDRVGACAGRYRHPHHVTAVGGAGGAVLRQRDGRPGRDYQVGRLMFGSFPDRPSVHRVEVYVARKF
jgi:hypothetical protein